MPVSSAVKDTLAKKIAGEIVLSNRPGTTLRKWRNILNITQTEMASRLEVSPSVVSDYEAGRRVPGTKFVRRFVENLLAIEEDRGGRILSQLVNLVPSMAEAIVDVKEFPVPVKAERIVEVVDGVIISGQGLLDRDIYGYTVLDSISAIQTFSGADFYQILGATTERALVFTNVSTGRSPMVAVRVQTLKPRMIVIHGLKEVDRLAVHLAELERIPLIKSRKPSVEALVEGLNLLHRATKAMQVKS